MVSRSGQEFLAAAGGQRRLRVRRGQSGGDYKAKPSPQQQERLVFDGALMTGNSAVSGGFHKHTNKFPVASLIKMDSALPSIYILQINVC